MAPGSESRTRRTKQSGWGCAICGAPAKALQNFCGQCGAPIGAPTSSVPEHLQQRVRNARVSLEVERKYVTILFADVVGSTALIRDLDPEQAAGILDPVLQGMVRAVHAHGGVVTRIQGDGIMALFGAPLAQEEHAGRACRAAIDIRALPTDSRVSMRIGLYSGEVALRIVRNAGAVEYDAVGICVHIASRIEQTAIPKTIRVGDTTAQLLETQFEVRPVGSIPARDGSERQIPVFEVFGEATLRSRWSAATSRSLSPFIGRLAETDRMKSAAVAAGSGLGQVITIQGHAGTGKSRLLHEFGTGLERAGWQILEASAVNEEQSVSYGPFLHLLVDCLNMDVGSSDMLLSEKLAQAVTTAYPQLRSHLPALSAVFGVSDRDPDWAATSPAGRQRRIFEAVASVISEVCCRRNLLIIAEDVHWFDRESQALLLHLIEVLRKCRALVIATFRPEYDERWIHDANCHRIVLRPLSASDCHRLLDATLGPHPSLAAVKTHLVSRTQGVPFFVEEMVWTLRETGVLAGEPGDFEATAPTAHVQIPDRVQPVLAARIDRLPASAKEILQVAAAIGSEFDLRLIAEVLGQSPVRLAPILTMLEEGDFIFGQKARGLGRFAFRHVLIQEVTYKSLPSQKRQNIHRALALAIESVYPHRLKAEAEALAHHSFEGQLWEHAVVSLKQAALKAVEHAAHQRAILWIEKALEALRNLPGPMPQRTEAEIELRLLLRESLGALGLYDRWVANVDEAERLAQSLGDSARVLAIRVARLHLHNVHADIRDAVAACSEARRMALAHGDPQHIVAATYFESQAQNWRGDYRAAIRCVRETLPVLDTLPVGARCGMTGTAAVMFHSQLAACFASIGAFTEAVGHGQNAWRLAAHTKRDFDLSVASFGYGLALLLKGTTVRAAQVLQKGLSATERADIPLLFASLTGPLSRACVQNGDVERALKLTKQAMERSEVSAYSRGWTLLARAEVCFESGLPGSRALAEAALESAHRRGYQALQAFADLLLCRLLARTDNALAREHLAAASSTASRLRLAPLEAHCFAESARLNMVHQPNAAAAVAVDRRYRSLGMRFRLAKTATKKVVRVRELTQPTH